MHKRETHKRGHKGHYREIKGEIYAWKKKKRNGMHSKNKGDGGMDAVATANGSPAPNIAPQQQGKDAKEAATAKAARESEHSLAGEAGKQVRKKNRKRKNKFAATGEDAEAGGKGGAGQTDTLDQPDGECSRKKLKLHHKQDADRGRGGKKGSDKRHATADVHISASARKEENKPKGMGNVATAVSAKRIGQGWKGAGGGGARVKDLARGRGSRETGPQEVKAMESKAKERSEDLEEQKEAATQPTFPFQHMSSLACSRSKLTPLQAKLAAKLQGAHFRMLNEQLYTTPSSSAVVYIHICIYMYILHICIYLCILHICIYMYIVYDTLVFCRGTHSQKYYDNM